VTIEPLRSGHGALLFDVLRADSVYEFIDERPPESVAQLERRHAYMLDPDSPPDDQRWLNWLVVEHRPEAERSPDRRRVVGTVQATIHLHGHLDDRMAVVAYILAPDRWGRGIASQAVKLMLEKLINDHGVSLARANIDGGNRRSIALVDRLGFKPSDQSPDRDGSLVYDLLLTPRYTTTGSTDGVPQPCSPAI